MTYACESPRISAPATDDREHARAEPFPTENIFGHLSRVHWMADNLETGDKVLEVGCGTGFRVTLPLTKWGHRVVGIDRDAASIDYGGTIMEAAGLPAHTVIVGGLDTAPFKPDVVIVSEVLEHMSDEEITLLLTQVWELLSVHGRLLVTVPNGYGWFEAESWLWFKTGLGVTLKRSGFVRAWPSAKRLVFSGEVRNTVASTLSTEPHVQRFTLDSIQARLGQAGFRVIDARGSVLGCGPISDLLLSGSLTLQSWNRWLGLRAGPFAAGFYISAEKPANSD